MGQNEKIAREYGCTHVALIDGCSQMICGYVSMEVKNPILIHEYVFCPAILKYGLWNQLRIDHGQEFSLCVFVQDLLKNYRQSNEKKSLESKRSLHRMLLNVFGMSGVPGLISQLREL